MRKIFFSIGLFLIVTSFFWDDEEKQLKQLYQAAEAAFTSEKFEEAAKSYEEALAKVDSMSWQKAHMDWRMYVDTVLRLCISLDKTKRDEDVKNWISKLLTKKPPEEYIGPIRLLKARLSYKHLPKEQYFEMKTIHSFYPLELWRKEDISFFHALEFSLDLQNDALVHKAKRKQITGFYEEAISLYDELLDAIEKGHYPKANLDSFLAKKIRFHLAECHYAIHQYEQAIHLCEKSKNDSQIDREMIYLAALCFKEKQEYEKSLELFQRYFSSAGAQDLQHYDHALFEIGHFYYRKNQLTQAKRYFGLLKNLESKKKPALLAHVYLAKISLQENMPEEVEKLLSTVSTEFAISDPLRYECFFLRGQAFFERGHYEEAKEFFEKALPQNQSFGSLTRIVGCSLGLSYLKLAEDETKTQETRLLFCEKAETIFEKLKWGESKGEARLGLAKVYLLKNRVFQSSSLDKVHKLLSEQFDDFSLCEKLDALLLRAEAASTFEEKENFYKAAIDPIYLSLPKYAEGWMLRGLNYFQEGLKKPSQGSLFFDTASFCFEQAFQKLDKNENQQAARLIKLEAKSHFYRNSPTNSLALLEKLLTQFQESVTEREETLYLRGLIAYKLQGPGYLSLAEESFQQIIKDYPNGKYVDRSIHMLGTLYFKKGDYQKAKESFIQLGNQFPDSPLAPDSLFWAAEAEERRQGSPANLRIQLYKTYPNSPRAPEAYFRQFPYECYLGKNPEAISHLKEFCHLFPHSSLLVCANCLLGMNEQFFESAEAFFEEALTSFQSYVEEGKPLNSSLVYFRYRSLLELAELYLSHEKKLDNAVAILSSINNDFTADVHPFAVFLKEKSLYPPIFEESEFTLARVFLKLGADAKALECFAGMLKHYNEAKISKGTFLALLWREEGKLAMKARDFDTAIKCFEIAVECGSGHLLDDHILSLWILQSSCHKEKKNYDLAMRLLSRVINADMVSNLRLEAMSLRAEIYELQNRPELAIRQLEAAAKKGSFEAQEKLKVKYGL